MTLERFENGLGIGIETFIEIITNGFYYINKKDNEIYWYGNRAVFIGNGHSPNSNNMVITHFLADKIDYENQKILKDQHYWDWAKEEDVFCFKDYGKTWSVNREDLE